MLEHFHFTYLDIDAFHKSISIGLRRHTPDKIFRQSNSFLRWMLETGYTIGVDITHSWMGDK